MSWGCGGRDLMPLAGCTQLVIEPLRTSAPRRRARGAPAARPPSCVIRVSVLLPTPFVDDLHLHRRVRAMAAVRADHTTVSCSASVGGVGVGVLDGAGDQFDYGVLQLGLVLAGAQPAAQRHLLRLRGRRSASGRVRTARCARSAHRLAGVRRFQEPYAGRPPSASMRWASWSA
jgi:hypothetical protein